MYQSSGHGGVRPLVVVDLESVVDPAAGALTVGRIHAHAAPDRPLVVLGPRDTDRLRGADAAGIVVTGSAAMLDEVDWAMPLAAALVDAAGAGVPVLGVCFGHQMLAAHLGGTVSSFDEVRRGLPDIAFRPGAGRAGPFVAETLPLLHTHRDHVSAPPPGMEVVATGGYGGVPALAHRSLPLWTLQGHPEWDADVCRHDSEHWGRFRDEALDTPEAKGILHRFGALLPKA